MLIFLNSVCYRDSLNLFLESVFTNLLLYLLLVLFLQFVTIDVATVGIPVPMEVMEVSPNALDEGLAKCAVKNNCMEPFMVEKTYTCRPIEVCLIICR